MRIVMVLMVVPAFVFGCSSRSDLEWHSEDGYRWADLDPGTFGRTGFEQVGAPRTNITFRNDVRRELIEENRHYLNGSGVAAGDTDGDGWVDLYFAGLDAPDRLYRNLGGFRFDDVTEEVGLADDTSNSTGAVFADVDGDGHLDLLVTSLSRENVLYMNDGRGNFVRKADSGLGESKGAMTMALADINGDRLLDLYITNYKLQTVRDVFGPAELALENTVEVVDGETRVVPPFDSYYGIIETADRSYRNEWGEADEMYLNQGDGVFGRVDVAQHFLDEFGNAVGLPRDWGLSAAFHDVNGDMHPDLYVANDFWTPDRLWMNQGDGTFRAIETQALRSMSFASMGVDFSDIDRDGSVDFVVTEMLSSDHSMRMRQYSEHLEELEGRPQYNRNSVYLNRGDNTFAQIAYFSGLESTGWSWGTRFVDVDLDGYEDLIVATGFAYDYQDMDTQIAFEALDRGAIRRGSDVLEYPPLRQTNKIFRNGKDLTFEDKSEEWGFDEEDLSFGMALADLDNDGSLDVVLNRMDDEAAIYRNRSTAARIAVRLNGEAPNTEGIGAKIELQGGPVDQTKEMSSGGGYLSGSQAMVVFAAVKENEDHVITVTWPGGKQSRVEGVSANRIYVVDESGAAEAIRALPARSVAPLPLFQDVSDRIGHQHEESEYDDFRFEPLLPLKLSRLGPGVAWIDFDQDGDDDLFITAGKRGRLALFENLEGRFRLRELDELTRAAPGDQTSILGWGEDNQTKIVVGMANYEQGAPGAASAYVYSIDQSGRVEADSIAGILSTTGPMAAADYSGDGSIDLFVGGRFVPGRYPQDAQSRLFKNVNGSFQLDEDNSRVLAELGLVTGAVFSDFDRDGSPDLLVSTEWGSLRLFGNEEGTFIDRTAHVGLAPFLGWWSGVATGDFNNDGLPDILAANLGTNSAYQTSAAHPMRMYFDDFNRDGRLNIVETYYSDHLATYVPRRQLTDFESIPAVFRRVRSHADFATSSADELFDTGARSSSYKEINSLAHMMFVNTGAGFEARPLPREAQFTAASHAAVADFNSDGHDDLFLSQNFFALPVSTPRLDAGRGLLLLGDGKGNLTPMSGDESGIKIYGEQRGAAQGDFDGDGRIDVAVSQNNGETRLFHNRTGTSGIRVRLIGAKDNRDAIGSSMQIVYDDDTRGPLRELQAGSGYWSQGSMTHVLGTRAGAAGIDVSWYDGTVESVRITPGTDEYTIER